MNTETRSDYSTNSVSLFTTLRVPRHFSVLFLLDFCPISVTLVGDPIETLLPKQIPKTSIGFILQFADFGQKSQ